MSIEALTVILFGLLVLLLISGLPIAFGMGATAVILILWRLGPEALHLITATAFSSWGTYTLVALPLYVLMANFLAGSGIADDLYEMMYHWMGSLSGGLAMGTVVICTIFAAMSGVSAAGTVTMGLVALPSMLKRGYQKDIAIGCIAAGGSLGILIPPSVIMVVFATLTGESVGRLFMGGVFSGLVLSAIFISYIGTRCLFQPHLGPAVPKEERASWHQKLKLVRAVISPIILVLLVLGTIYTGVATPTEAAAVGALGALICAVINRRFSWRMFKDATLGAFRLSVLCMWIVLGAKLFSHIYTASGASAFVLSVISGLEVNRWLIMITMQLILLIMGCFIDPMGIMMITVPVFAPIVTDLGFNMVWFGILFTINMEMAFITPPFGFNLFYMKGVVPKSITMADIYRSIVPFVFLEMLGLALVMVFPQLALWLPDTMLK